MWSECLSGDLNENGKIDQQDLDFITVLRFDSVSFSPYLDKKDEWWIFCYYYIIGDANNDGTCDSSDEAAVETYLADITDISDVVSAYDIYDTDTYWCEEELKNYNY